MMTLYIRDMTYSILRLFGRFAGEPSKKRSKLVLPTPQISDQELEEVRSRHPLSSPCADHI